MRSSKSRSRSKSNRSRSSMGNVVNRVFDSSGPEGKVRGTPQQIIDKYTQLARDAQLSNDRVAAENFQQHAEHYTRMLGEAQREQDARREQQEAQQQQHRERQQNNQNTNNNNQNNNNQQRHQPQPDQTQAAEEPARRDPAEAPQPEVVAENPPVTDDIIDVGTDDSGLVETPESKPKPKPKAKRAPRARKPKADAETPAPAPVEEAKTES